MTGYDFEHVVVMLIGSVPAQVIYAGALCRFFGVQRKWLYWAIQILAAALLILVFWEVGSWQRVALSAVVSFSPVFFGEIKLWRRLTIALLASVVMMLMDFALGVEWMLVTGEVIADYDVAFAHLPECTLLVAVNIILMAVAFALLGRFLEAVGLLRGEQFGIMPLTATSLIGFPLVQLAILTLIVRILYGVNDQLPIMAFSLAVVVLFVLADVAVVVAVAASSRRRMVELRSRMLEERVDSCMAEFREAAVAVERAAHARHDARNNAAVIEELWKNGDASEARRMCADLRRELG